MITPRQREQARIRQAKRRALLAEQSTPIPSRHCLYCLATFLPKRRDSLLCSRPCIDRVSYHRKRARAIELAVIMAGVHQHLHGTSNPLKLEELQDRWLHDPRPEEVGYRLWFPDLCGLTPEQAEKDREVFESQAPQWREAAMAGAA